MTENLTLAQGNSTGPSDASTVAPLPWQPITCVAYVVLVLCSVVFIHVRFERKGSTRWETVDWFHVAHGIGWCNPTVAACFRLSAAAFIFYVDYALVASVQNTKGMTSRLIGGALIFATFTVWCWTLLGLYFASAGAISACEAVGWQPSTPRRIVRMLCLATWVLFEVTFTCALLVSTVTWTVLVPTFYYYTGSDMGLLSFLPLCVHNVNILLLAIETLMNRLHFVRAHFVFVLYYGCTYVVFSWIFFAFKGFFYYFFIDWRYRYALVSYTLMLCFLGAFFLLGQYLSHLTNGGGATKDISGDSTSCTSSEVGNGDSEQKDNDTIVQEAIP